MSKSTVCRWVQNFEGGRTEIHDTAHTGRLSDLDAEYCRAGLHKLHKRYTKCLDLQVDYVEK